MANSVKCPFCNSGHLVDSYGWVQACVGYMPEDELQLMYEAQNGGKKS